MMEQRETVLSKIIEKCKEINFVDTSKTAAKAIIGEIPGLSAFLDVWNEHEAIEQERKLKLFLKAFVYAANANEKRFKALENDVKSVNERMDEFGRILKSVKEEVSESKVGLLSSFAINIFLSPENHDTKINLLLAFNELTETDFNILSVFGDKQTYRIEKFVTGNLTFEDLILPFSKLESRGLIGETSGKDMVTRIPHVNADWRDKWESKYYEILPAGKQLLKMLE